jgi:nitroimidazol reductase NimA-like FMN-containing flavoprotein (pyridoxamine 5'-phosphate oxidase superfamily)
MESNDSIALDAEKRDNFLGNGGTGVISLSEEAGESPHSVPVSYGYDPVESTFYFRLATGPESEKGDLNGRAASFVTYGDTEDGWWSVVAEGNLERTTDENVSNEALQGLERVTIPYVDIFDRPLREVMFEFYRLDPQTLMGRKEQ